jgi:hypothetical protein
MTASEELERILKETVAAFACAKRGKPRITSVRIVVPEQIRSSEYKSDALGLPTESNDLVQTSSRGAHYQLMLEDPTYSERNCKGMT